MWWVQNESIVGKTGEMGETGAHVTNCHAIALISKHVSNLSIKIIPCYKHLNKKPSLCDLDWISLEILRKSAHAFGAETLHTLVYQKEGNVSLND